MLHSPVKGPTAVSNNTEQRDKATMLTVWKVMDKDEGELRYVLMSMFKDITVEGGRAKKLEWYGESLCGATIEEIWALPALTCL